MTSYNLKLAYPVNMSLCVLTQGFGVNLQDYAQFGLKGHNGHDFARQAGGPTEIYCTDDGSVIEARFAPGPDGFDAQGWGNYVRVQHAWGKSIYAHASRIDVAAGAKVLKGQLLGLTGDTGNSFGNHLHFGVYPTGEPTNNGFNGAIDPTGHYAAVTQPPVVTPAPVSTPLKAGKVQVTATSGLWLREEPVKDILSRIVIVPYKETFEIGEATRVVDGVVYRRVFAWIAESENGVNYLVNV